MTSAAKSRQLGEEIAKLWVLVTATHCPSMDAEIIAVGSELLTPFRQDTNSLYLTGKLNSLGIEVRFKTIVGDDRERLAELCRAALGRSELVILSGGLGPTEDDLNREVVAEVLGRPLARGRGYPPANAGALGAPRTADAREQPPAGDGSGGRRLAEERARHRTGPLDRGARPHRAAAARSARRAGSHVRGHLHAAPGPRSGGMRLRTRVYKVVGSARVRSRSAASRLFISRTRTPRPPSSPHSAPSRFICGRTGSSDREADALLTEVGDKIELALGDHIFSSRGETLEEVVGMYLVMKQKTVAVAESCTGGLVAERLTRVPGSSSILSGRSRLLQQRTEDALGRRARGVDCSRRRCFQARGAGACRRIRRRTGAALGLGITGIAGPGGGRRKSPSVWFSSRSPTNVRPKCASSVSRRARADADVELGGRAEMIRRRVRE